MAAEEGRLILGTSGFSYQHWRGDFYPIGLGQGHWLEYYAEHFSAVELNVTFYRLPKRETFRQWANRTPADFRFIVKGSRLITHFRRMGEVDEALDRFKEAATALGDKLDCVLWQLPPTMSVDLNRLDRFCGKIVRVMPTGVRHAFEFRDASWFAEDVYGVLRRHRCALVWADPGREGQSRETTADFAYMRFHHGPRESGCYERRELDPYAVRARGLLADGADVYAMFNNDPNGCAPVDAAELRRMIGAAVPIGTPSQ